VPATPTYPGVYIEEVPSAVHTIVGVATSITAFVGYTKRGSVDMPVEVFNFGDFERAFGGLDVDSPLTYAVQQFFLNGGTDAFVVRAAAGAQAASMELQNDAGTVVLVLSGNTAGQWANALQVTVDRGTQNPASLFNLTATEYVPSGAGMVPGRVETFRNLTMDATAATYAVDTIRANSTLLDAERGAGIPAVMPAPGTSTSGPLDEPIVVPPNAAIMVSVGGGPPVSVTIPAAAYTRPALAAALDAETMPIGATVAEAAPSIQFTDAAANPGEQSSVHVTPAPGSGLARLLALGVANGGTEIDAIAPFMPAATGTTGGDIDTALGAGGLPGLTPAAGATATINVTITLPNAGDTSFDVVLLSSTDSLATKEELRSRLERSIRAAALANPPIAAEIAGTTVALVANRLVATAGGRPSTMIAIADAGADGTATLIGFAANTAAVNIAAYNPAIGPLGTQGATQLGDDGTPPGAADLIGEELDKTGMQALVDVDLFNLLVLPDVIGTDDAVLTAAMRFCEEHRAMLITDLPEAKNTLTLAHDWIVAPATPKSSNAAAYFPRPLVPDPLQGYRQRKMPGAGAIAGLYARTDSGRGVWKAPAGTDAALRGPTDVAVALTDAENGKLNPFGLNAVRSLPIYGIVVWGARTLDGADVMASQWKYVPVRRLALYIEESLFRGTKWVVFEPNDEPLWAQIRLNVGAFMHSLFRQGAFQGAAPRKAYLVKCDGETTTQADIDQGIVNIIVGFAPLKPAEFVVIKITQLAGQLET
jgi:Bacteriophage tail sheath protein